VASVTINRSKKYSKGICKVVYSPAAFSWTRNKNLKIKDKIAFEKAKRIAASYLQGNRNSKIGDRLFFNERTLGKRFKTKNKPIIMGKLMYY
jgi:spore germination cell wall hydrolase CwlJ-like protein